MRRDRKIQGSVSKLTSGSCCLSGRNSGRRGAIAVETALLVPFLAMVVLGITEIGQVQRAHCYVSEATYVGGVTASLPASSNAQVISDVKNCLTSCKMTASSAVITIKVNDVAVDVATAQRNDKITVSVSVPISATSWVGSHFFISNSSSVSVTAVMLRQG